MGRKVAVVVLVEVFSGCSGFLQEFADSALWVVFVADLEAFWFNCIAVRVEDVVGVGVLPICSLA